MTAETYLSIRGLVKSYDGRTNAVDHVDIDVRKGEFISFLGPSGSGKTTTLMMIAGFESPTAGQILLEGDNLVRRRSYERDIGVVFQNYALFPHMTVAENVGFPLRMRQTPMVERRRRVGDALAMVGLAEFADKRPKALSGGQQQRVALARGLIFNPRILLLDEPLGALDKRLREQMQLEIKRIHRDLGVTMIYVTHDQSEAMTMADRIAVFNNGRIEHLGPPQEIYETPATEFVADFVGESNILRGTLVETSSGTADIDGLGRVVLPPDRVREKAPGPIALLLRPEWIDVVDDVSPGGGITLSARVVDVVNQGGTALAITDIDGRRMLVRAQGFRIAALTPDARVGLRIHPSRLRVIGGRPAAGAG
jgi:putative spermidine/putrescine transport system ATP-binding protein